MGGGGGCLIPPPLFPTPLHTILPGVVSRSQPLKISQRPGVQSGSHLPTGPPKDGCVISSVGYCTSKDLLVPLFEKNRVVILVVGFSVTSHRYGHLPHGGLGWETLNSESGSDGAYRPGIADGPGTRPP